MNAGDKFETLEGEIIAVSETRKVPTKYGKKINVATATFKSNETGVIPLTLWADNIVKVKPGDKVRLSNVEVREFRGTLSLSVAPPSQKGLIERI